ncbi:TPA: hypothetical protein ACOTHO_002422 [Clostridium perfringens]|nr:hypothetical protein [Clostridium perfringens]MDU2168947.1 hypothetical protein [Clostridium perfringens]MDU6143963.1 hypothetical protein [Clostridium perfringens]
MNLRLMFERIIKRGYLPEGKENFGKKLDFMYGLNRLTDEDYAYLVGLLNPVPVVTPSMEHETNPVVVAPTEIKVIEPQD